MNAQPFHPRWYIVDSSILGEWVAVVRDEAAISRIPAHYKDLTVYAEAEVLKLRGADAHSLAVAHAIKKADRHGATVESRVDEAGDEMEWLF